MCQHLCVSADAGELPGWAKLAGPEYGDVDTFSPLACSGHSHMDLCQVIRRVLLPEALSFHTECWLWLGFLNRPRDSSIYTSTFRASTLSDVRLLNPCGICMTAVIVSSTLWSGSSRRSSCMADCALSISHAIPATKLTAIKAPP